MLAGRPSRELVNRILTTPLPRFRFVGKSSRPRSPGNHPDGMIEQMLRLAERRAASLGWFLDKTPPVGDPVWHRIGWLKVDRRHGRNHVVVGPCNETRSV